MGMAMVMATAMEVVLVMFLLLPLYLITMGVDARQRLLWGDGVIGRVTIIGMTSHITGPITGGITDITMEAHTTRHRPHHTIAPAITTGETGFISIIVTTAQSIRGADGIRNSPRWVGSIFL